MIPLASSMRELINKTDNEIFNEIVENIRKNALEGKSFLLFKVDKERKEFITKACNEFEAAGYNIFYSEGSLYITW